MDNDPVKIDVPSGVKKRVWSDFMQRIFMTIKEGGEITIDEAAKIGEVDKETASKYLELSTKFPDFHIKGPEYKSRKIYIRGCTPAERSGFQARIDESSVGDMFFTIGRWTAGLTRPWRYLLDQSISWDERTKLFGDWMEEYGLFISMVGGFTPILFLGGVIACNELVKNWERPT